MHKPSLPQSCSSSFGSTCGEMVCTCHSSFFPFSNILACACLEANSATSILLSLLPELHLFKEEQANKEALQNL